MAKRKSEGRALVIVESPAKAKTINKYLGHNYVVKASLGHVRDLPTKEFGIDVSDGFKPSYEVVKGRVKVVSELKRLAAEAPEVYLATDLEWGLQYLAACPSSPMTTHERAPRQSNASMTTRRSQ